MHSTHRTHGSIHQGFRRADSHPNHFVGRSPASGGNQKIGSIVSQQRRNIFFRMIRRTSSLFRDQEIYFRSNGEVRFMSLSRRVQVMVAGAVALALAAWALGTGAMLWGQADVALERAAIEAQQDKLSAEAQKVKAVKASVDDIAQDLEARQRGLEALVEDHFGADAREQIEADAASGAGTPAPKKVGDARLDRLRQIEARQLAFVAAVTKLANARVAKAEAAIRSFGLNPAQMRASTSAQGGPYEAARVPAELQRLAVTLGQLDSLESALAAIPSGQPTAAPMLTSSFGYRRDPFNGHPAFHAGVDFPGAYGQPILAAARGRVAYVGQRQGYGNVVEVDHGNGLMTRYAHLAGFATKVGSEVRRGEQLGRMGSTGRSTGTHLHFEVRVNGNPINPRRFLEASDDVLQVQQSAGRRISNVRDRG